MLSVSQGIHIVLPKEFLHGDATIMIPKNGEKNIMDNNFMSSKILIVDDDEGALRLFEAALRATGYTNIKSTPDSRGVLAHFVEEDPDILILDIMMPHLNGFQLLGLLQDSVGEGLSLPVLMTTAALTTERKHTALERGAIDVMEKPFEMEDFLLRVRNLLKLRAPYRELEAQNRVLFEELIDRTDELVNYRLELKETQLEVISRLARAGEQHDDDTGKHTQRVAIISALLAQELGLSEEHIEVIQKAAPLHDVGKIGVSDSILLKPGKLTAEEFRRMQKHCELGAELLSGGRSEVLKVAETIALSHHERWNGKGYPHGLAGENIPLEGRILAVADVFDALTHERPYKHAWSIADAKTEICQQTGQQFDPQIVECFMKLPHDRLI